jgi:hypothetical protein
MVVVAVRRVMVMAVIVAMGVGVLMAVRVRHGVTLPEPGRGVEPRDESQAA